MNEPLESRLRRDLAVLERLPIGDADMLAAASATATVRLARRRRALAGSAAVLVLAAGGVGAWALRARPSDPVDVAVVTSASVSSVGPDGASSVDVTSVPSPPPVAPTATTAGVPSAWRTIPPDPRGAAASPMAVWTGAEALVVGGRATDGSVVAGAAAYSPATGTWRRLADPQNGGGRVDALVAWTGREMLVLGGDLPDGGLLVSYGEAYDPARGSWRYTASPPGFVNARSPWAWTGTELLLWPWDAGGSTMDVTPIAYDPAADSWRTLAPAPVERRQQAASVWTGTEWIVWGGLGTAEEVADGAAYDPATDSWRVLAPSPLSARRVRGVWTGRELVVAAGSRGGDRVTGNGTLALADGAAYDPATDSWRPIASGLGHPGFEPLWTGSQLLMFAKGGVVVYDVGTDRWVDSCCSESGGGVGGTPLWTGSTALLVGSVDGRSGGSTFTPPGG